MKAAFVDVGGIRTRYLHEGTGQTVMLIHGFGLSADIWIKVLDPIAQRYHVVAPDILGHGFTQWQDLGDGLALKTMVNHLADFMDALNIKKCAVVGSSLGSVLAALLCQARPQQMSHLVIDAMHTPVSDKGTIDPDGLRAAMANGSQAMKHVSWRSCIERMGNICFDPSSSPTDIAMMQTTIYAQDDRLTAYTAIGESIADSFDDDQIRILPEQIKQPTLFLFGREDPRVSVRIIEKNHGRIENSRVEIFEKCGHLPEVEYPEKFVEALFEFLRG